jgi:antitoxin component YwqK of YwqJK toxin-antitoxin module
MKMRWGSVRCDDGRVLLEGPEEAFYENGKPMWRVNFHLGEKTGVETYFRADGTRAWEKKHLPDGKWSWTLFDESGKHTAESNWQGKHLLNTTVPDVAPEKKTEDAKLPDPEGL